MRYLATEHLRYGQILAESPFEKYTMAVTSLRERQKERTRQDMLAAAMRLFSKKGYAKTTMHAIADDAGVGIATLFRYYNNKSLVLAALILQDLEEIFAVSDSIVNSPTGTVDETMTDLLVNYICLLDKPSKKLPGGKSLVLGIKSGKKELDDVVSWSDEYAKKQISKVLTHYKHKGELNSQCSVKDLTTIIFSLFNYHYVNYVTDNESNLEKLKKKLSRHTSILFKSWYA